MKGFSTEIKVGIFAMVVIVFLLFMTFKVGGLTWLKSKDSKVYYAYFNNIAGLDEKTRVKVAGVEAGVIEKIELTDGVAKLRLRMDPGVVLNTDSCATIKASGLLGDKYLEVTVGSIPPPLQEGDTITCIQQTMEMDDLITNLAQVSGSLNELIVKMNNALTKEDIAALKDTLNNIKESSAVFRKTIEDNNKKIYGIVDNFQDVTVSLKDLISKNGEALDSIIANLQTVSGKLGKDGPAIVDDLKYVSGEFRAMIEESGPEFKNISKNAGTTMEHLSQITDKLEKGEGTMGKLLKDEKLYDSLTSAVENVDNTLSRINRFRTYISFQGDYLEKQSDGKGHFYVTLKPTEDKYYILGIVSDPLGSTETTTTTTDGVTVVEKKVEKDIEFTAHFVKRYKNTALRLGLTESTFGIGADQFFLDDKLNLSVDAWDFSEDEEGADNPHLRFGARYFVFKNLYLTGGIDNMLNDNLRGGYLGMGLMFEDEDFKYLFGSVPSIPGK